MRGDTYRESRFIQNKLQGYAVRKPLGPDYHRNRFAVHPGALFDCLFPEASYHLDSPYLTEEASVHHNKAEAGVHSAWSLFMSETLGNVTPATSAFVRKTIDPLLGPAIRNEALSLLEQQIDTIRRDQLSYSFEAREVQFDDRTGTAYVTGRHYTHQGIGNPERVNRTYEFRWEFKNYMPNLVHLDTYEGAPRVKQQN